MLNDKEKELAEVALSARRSVNVWYLDDPFATTASVRAAAAKVKMLAGGLSGIVVDYLQILKDKGDSEVQRVTVISRQIKAIAREFDVPLMVLSQLNRAVEMRDDPHPKLHDLRESGAIEQDADLVLGMTRQLGEFDLDIDVLKNRQGPLGRVQLYFDPSRVTFTDDPEGMPW
jgi:replicative DNA helicase